MEWAYTTIQHGPRKQMGLSCDEYVLLDCIWHTQTSEVYGKNGWCEHPYSLLADMVGLKKSGVFQMVDRLVRMELMEVDMVNPMRKRAAVKFHLMAHLNGELDEEGTVIVQKVNDKKRPVQKVNGSVQKVNAERSESERHININSNSEENINSLSPAQNENFEPQHIWGDGTETRFEKAQAAVKTYFEKNPSRWQEIAKAAKNHCNAEQFDEELSLWIRRYADDFQITQNPVKALTSGRGSFISWLSQTWCREKYQNHGNDTSTPRNGRVQQRRAPESFPSSEELRRKYGVL